MLKLVVLNKDTTFRLQTWTVELGCAAQGYHSQAADFLSRSEMAARMDFIEDVL